MVVICLIAQHRENSIVLKYCIKLEHYVAFCSGNGAVGTHS